MPGTNTTGVPAPEMRRRASYVSATGDDPDVLPFAKEIRGRQMFDRTEIAEQRTRDVGGGMPCEETARAARDAVAHDDPARVVRLTFGGHEQFAGRVAVQRADEQTARFQHTA